MRRTDVPDTGLLCDLLRSDRDKDITGWSENDSGVLFTFGLDGIALPPKIRYGPNLSGAPGRRGQVRVLREVAIGNAILGAELLWRVRRRERDDECR